MPLIVQKYGGTSLGEIAQIQNVAKRIKATRDKGYQVAVVVSARGGITNQLITRAKALHATPNRQEMDQLLAVGEQEMIALMSIALHALGVPAVSRTGAQAGILTNDDHTRARILHISGGDLLAQLSEGKVVIVAGFQGINGVGQITTLGRGGSDLTAIALAAVLKAQRCQIYTDVEGIYTADPRIVPDARKIAEISYEELLELASSGAQVMQARATQFAQKYGVIFEVRSSFNHNKGTIVKHEIPSMEDVVVSGIAVDRNQAQITLNEIPDQPGVVTKLFQVLEQEDIVVDMIVQNIGRKGKVNLSFTVNKEDVPRTEATINDALKEFGSGKIRLSTDIAKISVVGVGMRSHSGVAAQFFKALSDAGITIQMISTSEIKISVTIDPRWADEATRALHKAFSLQSDSLSLKEK